MNTYDRKFFEKRQSAALASARVVAPRLVEILRPRRVVDVGCGTGDWLSAFVEQGAEHVVGVDGPWVQKELLRIPRDRFVQADLERRVELDEIFDLALSVEVAEHLTPNRAESFVSDLVALAPVVLFSGAAPWQGGAGHINEQWPSYWSRQFARHGYKAIDFLRWEFWDNPDVCWWYAQNTVLYASDDALDGNSVLQELSEKHPNRPLSVVHPELYAAVADPERMHVSRWFRMFPHALKRVSRRLFRGNGRS